jgi:hypothetical protein
VRTLASTHRNESAAKLQVAADFRAKQVRATTFALDVLDTKKHGGESHGTISDTQDTLIMERGLMMA